MPTKACLAVTSQNCLQNLFLPPLLSPNSPKPTSRRPNTRPRSHTARRCYRSAHTDRSSHPQADASVASFDPSWPGSASNGATPSPYEILCQPRDRPYCRRRFLELVKLYHPDRTHGRAVPHALRVERYRLAVAADGILRDPARRRAYDRSEASWRPHSVTASTAAANDAQEDLRRYREGGGQWSRWDRNSPFTNATWEDWDEWHRRIHREWTAASRGQTGSGGGGGGGGGSDDPHKTKHDGSYDANGTWDGGGWGRKAWARPAASVSNGSTVILMIILTGFAAIQSVRHSSRRALETRRQQESVHGEAKLDLSRRRQGSRSVWAADSGWFEGFSRGN